MTPLKLIFLILMVLVPGGSLVLLALATAKALRAGRDRLLGQCVPMAGPAAVPARRG